MKANKVVLGVAAALLSPLVVGLNASAWGPSDRPTFTMQEPATYAVFNSITDNSAVGDERDFVRVEEKNSGRAYANNIEIEAGKQYEVYIYYHNDASKTFNDRAHNYAGVARDVRVSSIFPLELTAGEKGTISGTIMASNTNPTSVWDEAYVTAKEDTTLHYVEGSAKIYNNWGVNGSVLSTNLFSEMGTFIGLNNLDGVILGCDEYSGQIVYTIQTKAVDNPDVPPTPEDPDDPEVPEVPKELPSTGPAEIVLAVVLILVVAAGIFYWVKTHNAVKKATKKARGRK